MRVSGPSAQGASPCVRSSPGKPPTAESTPACLESFHSGVGVGGKNSAISITFHPSLRRALGSDEVVVPVDLAGGHPIRLEVEYRIDAPGLPHKMIIVGSAIVGLLLPEWILRFLQKRYIGAIEAGLPDMLDMLVMCTESGLSLEPALVRVCQEIGPIHPAMAQELRLTTGELHILTDTRMAFTNLGERSGVRGLKRLSSTLIQTLQYGTPLGPSLRSLTGEMRQEMLTKFEERAGRLPALLTLVMIVFILPSLFLTIGGPAIIQVLRQFGS